MDSRSEYDKKTSEMQSLLCMYFREIRKWMDTSFGRSMFHFWKTSRQIDSIGFVKHQISYKPIFFVFQNTHQ
jgi:hypothetical protein